MVTIVSPMPSVAHADVASVVVMDVVVATSVIPSVTSNAVPGMSSTISSVEYGTSVVEIVTMWIAGIDAEMPESVCPIERAIEIGGCTECAQLPVKQDIAQIQVAALPVGAIYIVITRDSHQVVEVNLISSLILLFCQVQLVSHLVSQEEGLVASLLVAHCLARCCYQQHCYQGYHHLLHTHIILISSTYFYLFTVQK